ncbi:MAG TPA: ABC transporter permease [Candidatus Limnocylindrales bacterium]|nr:ABC transporter permease [Candidatus Limnocylindrales bacterium]
MTPPALRVFEHAVLVYRRTWRGTLFQTFLTPVLFLAAMGLGLGGLIDRNSSAALSGVPYMVFLAPGLLAAQAMQTAAFENTFPVMAKTTWQKTYEAMLATPLRVRDLIIGDLAWSAVRLLLVATAFLAVMALFGAVRSPMAVLAIPAAALTGFAFAAPIFAFSVTQRNVSLFNALFRFGITPLFLFSGTFFPVDRLPEVIQPVAWITPLYHGVSLTRGLSLGTIDPLAGAMHVAVLTGFVVVGLAAGLRTLQRRMVK